LEKRQYSPNPTWPRTWCREKQKLLSGTDLQPSNYFTTKF